MWWINLNDQLIVEEICGFAKATNVPLKIIIAEIEVRIVELLFVGMVICS